MDAPDVEQILQKVGLATALNNWGESFQSLMYHSLFTPVIQNPAEQ
jgi:hypothetical protein